MNILDRYLARSVIGGTLMVLSVLVAVQAFVLFLSQGDNVGHGRYTLVKALLYVLSSTPQMAYEVFPMAVLLGTLLGLGQLASGNELTVVRASGVSILRLARILLLGGALLAMLCVGIGEVVAPQTERYAKHLKGLAMNDRLTVTSRQGIWAKDGDTFVNVRQLKGQDELAGVLIYHFAPGGSLLSATQAASAEHRDGGWLLHGVRETTIGEDGAAARSADQERWQSAIDPELLDLFVVDYSSLSGLSLWRYAAYLRANGLDAQAIEVSFWSRVVAPVNAVLMVLLGLPFVFGPLRSAGAGQRVVVGVLIGITFFALTKTLLNSGTVYGLDPFWTNWLPTLSLATVVGIGLVRVR